MTIDPFATVDIGDYPSCDTSLPLPEAMSETNEIVLNFLTRYGITPELGLFIGFVIGLMIGYLMVRYI